MSASPTFSAGQLATALAAAKREGGMSTLVGGRAEEQRLPLLGHPPIVTHPAVVTVDGRHEEDGISRPSSRSWTSNARVTAVTCVAVFGVMCVGGWAVLGGDVASLGDGQSMRPPSMTPRAIEADASGSGPALGNPRQIRDARGEAGGSVWDIKDEAARNAALAALVRTNRIAARKARIAAREAAREAAKAANETLSVGVEKKEIAAREAAKANETRSVSQEEKEIAAMEAAKAATKSNEIRSVGVEDKEIATREAAKANETRSVGVEKKEECKIVYYYHIPKTGGGSVVTYFGKEEGVQLLRYEQTMHIQQDNQSTLWYWAHQPAEKHWNEYIVRNALKPGKHFIAHHWGREGMLQMHKRLADLRNKAKASGCELLTSVTLREPVARDISDEVFRTIMNTKRNYLGNEQLRFLLMNSEYVSPDTPEKFNDPAVRMKTMEKAKYVLRNDFDLVATIEDLELQKNVFAKFLGLHGTHESPLGHKHKIDYAKQGLNDAEMQKMREKYKNTSHLDRQLYDLARSLSEQNAYLTEVRELSSM